MDSVLAVWERESKDFMELNSEVHREPGREVRLRGVKRRTPRVLFEIGSSVEELYEGSRGILPGSKFDQAKMKNIIRPKTMKR